MPKPLKPILAPTVTMGEQRKAVPGGWFSSARGPAKNARQRLGYSQAAQTSSLYESPESHYSFYRQYRSLMPEQYWSLYKSSPDVRSCVDSIVRRIATWDWYTKPVADPRDADEYERLGKRAEEVAAFLRVPNKDGQTWQELMTAMVTDLLVYDSGILELVEDRSEELSELVSWLGSEWFAVVDTHGRLIRYDQTPEYSNEPPVEVAPERICAFKLYPNNRSVNGLPLLESCITECLTVLLSSEHAMLALDADEIPPGLLVLGGVAGAAAERARADLQQMRGRDHRIRVVTSPEPSGIEARWVEMRHNMRDLEMVQIVDRMRHVIWRVFGVSPVELGESSGMPRASAEVQMDVSSSHLISPILEMIQARVNAQILPKLLGEDAGLVVFGFERGQALSPSEKLATAQRSEILLRRGVVTVNEVRQELGLLPVEGGDVATVETNMGPIPLDAVSKGFAPAMTMPGTQYSDVDDQYPHEYRSKLSDLPKKVQENLREKARKHNEEMQGKAVWRRTNASTLAEVYDRGIGAYYGNPESVRPTVTSAQQWAYARVNSFLYVLKNDKFRRGEHDTDLLPKGHPKSSKGRAVNAIPRFDRAPLQTAWGWNDAQRDRLLGDPADWDRYARAHLWHDGSGDERFSAYKFPVARIVDANDDEPKIVFRGVASVVGALKKDGKHESLSGVSIDDQIAVYEQVKKLYKKFGQEPPKVARLDDEMSDRAVGDTDPTNFPKSGDDKSVSLKNSQWKIFDPRYAQHLKERYPSIWKKGGNIRGNDQYRKLLPIIKRGGNMSPKTDTEEGAVRLREAWVARHHEDYRLAGVIAQIKWFAVGSRGEAYMKRLVDKEKEKVDAKRSHAAHECGESCEIHTRSKAVSLHGQHPASWPGLIERAAAITDLPSDWSPNSRFADVRTIDLPDLASLVASYTRTTARLYADAAEETIAVVRAAYASDQTLSPERAQRATEAVDDILDALAQKWTAATRGYYVDAARTGASSAERISPQSSVTNAEATVAADAFQSTAMSQLAAVDGLIGELRSSLHEILRNASTPSERSLSSLINAISELSGVSQVVEAAANAFNTMAHRVNNWSGKLVDLANQMFVETLLSEVTTDAQDRATVWYYEWATAGGRSCPTCANEGAMGFRRVVAEMLKPGQDTQCRGNCRCVLVMWTQQEVESGEARSMSVPPDEVSNPS